MRAACVPLVIGIALACSGEPFTASVNPQGDGAASQASGDGQSGSSTAGNAAAGSGSAVDTGGSAGVGHAGSGAAEPPADDVAGAPGGAPANDEGGAGGEGGAGTECASEARDDWELGYFPELRAATTLETHPFFQVTNRGEPTTLDRIAIRYYFTSESPVAETAICYWVSGDRCALAKLEFGDVPKPAAGATRYLQVSFPGASNVTVAAESLEVRVGFHTGLAPQIQTNDYSFDPDAATPSSAVPFPYKRWLKTGLYLSGLLVWGNEPCSGASTIARL